VQGYELEVLAGAEFVLGLIDWIYTEARFVQGVYQGAPLVNDVYVYPLRRSVMEVGFVDVISPPIGESPHLELKNLENEGRMPPGFVRLETPVLEATKPVEVAF
jgi:hypothetical protein